MCRLYMEYTWTERRYIPTPTNVVRIFNAVAKYNTDEDAQLCYYHPGVGTEGTWWGEKAIAVFGSSLAKNIKGAYNSIRNF